MRQAAFVPTWAGWRAAGRALLREGVAPESVVWTPADGESPLLAGLFAGGRAPPADGAPDPALRVPRAFFEIGEAAACFRGAERWALLYRALWRLTHGEPHLLEVASDPDVHRLRAMERAVGRDVHKLHAFVRFRAVETGEGDARYVAWYEPTHPVLRRATPFFARRFAAMRWSVLSPDECAHWDGAELVFGPGLPRSAAPRPDALEDLWRTYYAHTFNPARANPRAMRAEMPKRFWRNLPEAELIPALLRDAPARTRRMVEEAGLP